MTANTSSSSSVSTFSVNSSTDGGGGGGDDGGDGGGLDVVAALWIFGAPAIFTVGICGNALVLAVRPSRHRVRT